mgnify:CR=1 FL=1
MKFVQKLSILLFCSLVLSSCFEYEDVNFKGMQGFNIEERTDDHILLRIDLKVDNPNKYNIKIKKSALDIYLNGKFVGKTKMKKKIVLKKKTEDVYPVYLKTSGQDILKGAMTSLGSLLGGKINIGLKGDVKASVYGVGKKFPIDEEESVSLGGMF